VLNVSQNHLDRHKDIQEYFNAKKKIFMNQDSRDFAILNDQDERCQGLASQLKSQTLYFNSSEGRHLLDKGNPNFSVVLEVARILDISDDVCRQVFDEFKGVEHRLEWIRSVDGVDFINDSKATTAEASGWALRHIDQPVVMISGGKDKNIDFSVISDLVKKKVRKMIVFGEAREKIKKSFDGLVSIEECNRLEDAVVKAKENALEGDCVVLSPMCASFDMFTDFEERGKVYKEIVNQLD